MQILEQKVTFQEIFWGTLKSHGSLRPRFQEEKLSWERWSPSQPSQLIRECLYKKKGDPFAPVNSARACSDCLSPLTSYPSQSVHL